MADDQPDPLALIQGVNDLTDVLAATRNALVDKGWSSPGAEQAAISTVSILLMQQQGGGKK